MASLAQHHVAGKLRTASRICAGVATATMPAIPDIALAGLGPEAVCLRQFLLARKETEPWEIIYFKLYKSRLPVVAPALETKAMMFGSDKSRGYCLEMICAYFLAGSATQENQSEVLVLSLERLYQTLPKESRIQLAERIKEGP